MALQAPAHREYCPQFLRAVETLTGDPRTAATWSRFHTPWTFYETGDEYGRLFAAAGFDVVSAEVEELREHTTPERALEMFESGAAAGYLNPGCYDVAWPEGYAEAARELILADFRAQAAPGGLLELLFFRVYVLGRRP
jgi:hypothetical protein